MTVNFSVLKNLGVYLALLIGLLWIASWVVFLGVWPDGKWLGVPFITWSQIGLAVLSIGASIVAIAYLDHQV